MAFQSKLAGTMSVAGVTLARFIWAGPISAYLSLFAVPMAASLHLIFPVSLFSTLLLLHWRRSSRRA